jgi:hypothetical protein
MNPRSLLLLAFATGVRAATPDGAVLFEQNCVACHQPDQELVGPSLAEIRDLYTGKSEEFVRWSIAPEKKRPTAIEMPSMAHLGEPALLAIHAHIMEISKGLRAKKGGDSDRFGAAPTQALRPIVQRIFLPDASPASIAVALDERASFCWDAASCRLRYAWTGGFIDGFPYWRGNGSSLAKVIGKIRYTEAAPIFPEATVRFLGYELDASGFPSFLYQLGTTAVRESYQPHAGQPGFERRIQLAPAPTASLTITFPDTPEKTGIRVSKGKWDGATLTLSPAEAADFTLIHVFP